MHSQAEAVESDATSASGGSIMEAIVSATRTFCAIPMMKKDQPTSRYRPRSARSIPSRSSCSSRKRTIGPATSWENKDT
jgi:hypothetical protein